MTPQNLCTSSTILTWNDSLRDSQSHETIPSLTQRWKSTMELEVPTIWPNTFLSMITPLTSRLAKSVCPCSTTYNQRIPRSQLYLWKYLSFNSWQQWRKWAFDGVVVLYLRMSENMPDISLVRGSLTNVQKIGTISNIPHSFQLSHPSAINIQGHVSLVMWSLFIFKWYTARLVV